MTEPNAAPAAAPEQPQPTPTPGPAAEPAAAPAADIEVGLDDLEQMIQRSVATARAAEAPKPEAKEEPDPLAEFDEEQRPLAKRIVEMEEREARRNEAEFEARVAAEVRTTIEANKLTKAEVDSVLEYMDKHPATAEEQGFAGCTSIVLPSILSQRAKAAGGGKPKDGPPAASPKLADPVEIAGGGSGAPQDFKPTPKPGGGYSDITRWALDSGAAKSLVTRE